MRPLVMLIVLLVSSVTIISAQGVSDTECTPESLTTSQLVAGIDAEVISPNPIQLVKDVSADSELVAQLPSGTLVYVTSGPQCSGGDIWWQVSFDLRSVYGTRTFGWASEFLDAQRQLKPLIPALNPTLPRISVPIVPANLGKLYNAVEMGPLGYVQDFVWSPDSQYLAINTTHAVWVYHVTASTPNTPPIRLPGVAFTYPQRGGSVAFSPDGQTIATVGIPNGDLHLWSLSGVEQKVIPTQATDYSGVAAIAPDFSKWAITKKDNGSIEVWDIETGTNIQTLAGHLYAAALAFTPDGTSLVSMTSISFNESQLAHTIQIWDIASGSIVGSFSSDKPPGFMTDERSSMTISPDGKTVTVFAYRDQSDKAAPPAVYMLDIPSGTTRTQISLSGNRGVGNTTFNADSTVLALNSVSAVQFLNPADGTQLAQLPFEQNVQEIAFSPDGRWLVVAREDDSFAKSTIQFWGVLK